MAASMMNKSQRIDIVNKNVSELPGPGNYNDDSKTFGKDARSVTIRGRP
jgi:hypothetical protein